MAIEIVRFEWSDEYGPCHDCGRPAAWAVQIYNNRDEERFCSVCAAHHLAAGCRGVWLFDDDATYTCDGCGRTGTADDLCAHGEPCPDEECSGTCHQDINGLVWCPLCGDYVLAHLVVTHTMQEHPTEGT